MKYFTTVAETLDAIYEDCRNAKRSIYLEQYVLSNFNKGDVGSNILSLLIEKDRQGVKVEIILDAIGSFDLFLSPIYKQIKQSSIVLTFTRINAKYFLQGMPWETKRNHRKLIIIDDNIIYTGGVVFFNQASTWKDFQVRMTGNATNFKKAFKLSKNDLFDDIYFFHTEKDTFDILVNTFYRKNITNEIIARIRDAKSSITIFTPYFSPTLKIVELLESKASAGVVVSIYIPKHSNHTINAIVHTYYSYLLRKSNVRLLVIDGPMNHAKLIIIDDWVTFGSCNFDYLSLYYNKEINVTTDDATEVATITELAKEHFITDPRPAFQELYLSKNMFLRRFYAALGSLFRVIS